CSGANGRERGDPTGRVLPSREEKRKEKNEEKEGRAMEVIFHEDPACHWCWAFQPIETTFLFELGETLPPRRLMGGLRDHPFPDASLGRRQWEPAMEISDMPFEPAIWQRHLLRTTHLACSAVRSEEHTSELQSR